MIKEVVVGLFYFSLSLNMTHVSGLLSFLFLKVTGTLVMWTKLFVQGHNMSRMVLPWLAPVSLSIQVKHTVHLTKNR